MTTKNFLYRMLFTKSDDLDTAQAVLLFFYVLFAVVVVQTSRGFWHISDEVLRAFLWVIGLAALQAAPQWLAMEWLKSKSFWKAGFSKQFSETSDDAKKATPSQKAVDPDA